MTFVERVRRHWRAISTGMLIASLLGGAAFAVESRLGTSECCHPGAACCHPGAACCHHGAGAVAAR